MSNVKIKITAAFGGEAIEIDVEENITIKELKEAYVSEKARKKKGEREYTKEEKAALAKEIFEAEHNFKFALDTEILDDNRKLNDVFTGDVLKGEITITAITTPLSIAKCLRAINKLDPLYFREQKRVELERILREKTNEEDPSILASSDKNIVLAAVKQDGLVLYFVSKELKKDREIVLAAVKQDGWALLDASKELQADKEIVSAAVKQNGRALRFASKELRNDREIVLAAVQQNGLALDYASKELRNDPEIVLEAVQKNVEAFQFASEELRNDPEIVLAAVQRNGMALQFVSPELKKDFEIVSAAVQQNRAAFQFASKKLKKAKKFMLTAVQQNGEALMYAPEELQAEIVNSSPLKGLTIPTNKTNIEPGAASTSNSSNSKARQSTPKI